MSKKKTSKKKGNKSRKSSVPPAKSAAGKSPTPAPSTAGDAGGSAPAAKRAMPKAKYRPEELEEFRQQLLSKRAELVGDVAHMTDHALKQNPPGGTGNLSNMPIHMADVGSDAWEQEFTLGLVASERQLLKEIDDALQRIENRTYGVCEATHKRIGKPRLRAKPWARVCIESAQARDLGRAP